MKVCPIRHKIYNKIMTIKIALVFNKRLKKGVPVTFENTRLSDALCNL